MVASVLIGLIAALHVWIFGLEMFLWTTPLGRRAFNLTPEFADQTRALAANLGLYNGFLAAGLLTGLIAGTEGMAFKLFFLTCISIAGLFGAVTASRRILLLQTAPAIMALCALWAGL